VSGPLANRRAEVPCFGAGCERAATCTVIAEGIGVAQSYPACDVCAESIRGCDGVTIEPLAGVVEGGEQDG
jgi:hypothetical protein